LKSDVISVHFHGNIHAQVMRRRRAFAEIDRTGRHSQRSAAQTRAKDDKKGKSGDEADRPAAKREMMVK
jgi:hypothetical protein